MSRAPRASDKSCVAVFNFNARSRTPTISRRAWPWLERRLADESNAVRGRLHGVVGRGMKGKKKYRHWSITRNNPSPVQANLSDKDSLKLP